METQRYIIIGSGITAASAIEGIRAHDPDGPILLVTRENHAPYHRTPGPDEAGAEGGALPLQPVHDDAFYAAQNVRLLLRREVVEIDPETRVAFDERGQRHQAEALLIATGSRARRLAIPGGDADGVRYVRDLEDYLAMEAKLATVEHVTVLGGRFRAVELAASMIGRGKQVSMVYPDEYPLHGLLPRDLGMAVADLLRERGVETISGEGLSSIEERPGLLQARTMAGDVLSTQMLLVDAGTDPLIDLADAAGLASDDGIVVDEFACTSAPGVYAAGDVAEFPYEALGQLMRIETVDHAEHHGRCAGANMAGAHEPYRRLPALEFTVFGVRFAGVGLLDPRLDMEVIWDEPRREGAVFYLEGELVRGVMLSGQPGRLDAARALLAAARPTTPAERAAAIGDDPTPGGAS